MTNLPTLNLTSLLCQQKNGPLALAFANWEIQAEPSIFFRIKSIKVEGANAEKWREDLLKISGHFLLFSYFLASKKDHFS